MTKNYVRLDKLSPAAYLESVVFENDAILAGQFVELGTLVEGDYELTHATKAAPGSAGKVIVAPVTIDHGYHDYDPTDQSVKAGKAARAIHIEKGLQLSINAEAAPGVKVGDDVTVGADGLGFKKAGVNDEKIGKVIAIDALRNVGDLVVVRF